MLIASRKLFRFPDTAKMISLPFSAMTKFPIGWKLGDIFGIGAAETRKIQSRRAAIYGRMMREWVLFSSALNSVRRNSKKPRENGRPELRSKAIRKTKTSAFKA